MDVPQCDRVEEGDAFTPPDPNLENFVMANPGNEFPRSWTSRFQVEHEGRISYTAPTKFGLVKLDVDETFKCSLLEEVIPKAVLRPANSTLLLFASWALEKMYPSCKPLCSEPQNSPIVSLKPESKDEKGPLKNMKIQTQPKTKVPEFDQVTEDGVAFRFLVELWDAF